jgi:hypothetical protein
MTPGGQAIVLEDAVAGIFACRNNEKHTIMTVALAPNAPP